MSQAVFPLLAAVAFALFAVAGLKITYEWAMDGDWGAAFLTAVASTLTLGGAVLIGVWAVSS